jgi:hypothetical protein
MTSVIALLLDNFGRPLTLYFGHLLSRFYLPQAPRVRQVIPPAVSSSIDLSDAFDALLEFDD